MQLITDFKQIPMGLHLTRSFHESQQRHVFHVSLKVRDDHYYNQPICPVYSEQVASCQMSEFWEWAKANLPVYDHQQPIKSAI